MQRVLHGVFVVVGGLGVDGDASCAVVVAVFLEAADVGLEDLFDAVSLITGISGTAIAPTRDLLRLQARLRHPGGDTCAEYAHKNIIGTERRALEERC